MRGTKMRAVVVCTCVACCLGPVVGFGGPNPACGPAGLRVRVHWLLSRGVTRTANKCAASGEYLYAFLTSRFIRLTALYGSYATAHVTY